MPISLKREKKPTTLYNFIKTDLLQIYLNLVQQNYGYI